MNIKEHYHEVNGITLHTIEAGNKEGIPIIFLHGFPEFWYGWKNQVTFFAEKGYRVIVLTKEVIILAVNQPVLKLIAATPCGDIVALINKLTNKKVVIVGHDWGGVVAWRLAMDYPQLIQQLVIINMPHPDVFKQTLKTDVVQMLRSSYAAFFQLPQLPRGLLVLSILLCFNEALREHLTRELFLKKILLHIKRHGNSPRL
jgi:pimeloyl-ACP methyl ester carboxylesterase